MLDVIEVAIDRAAALALSVTPISKRVIGTQFPTVESMQWPTRQLFRDTAVPIHDVLQSLVDRDG